jgi:hypothetical protein
MMLAKKTSDSVEEKNCYEKKCSNETGQSSELI